MTDESRSPDEAWLFYQNPAQVAGMLFQGILDDRPPGDLANMVTPETVQHWGDFAATKAAIWRVDRAGIAAHGGRAQGADGRVAWIPVIAGVGEAFAVPDGAPVDIAGVFTMVYHSEGRWLAHSYGDQVMPQQIRYL